MKLNNHNLYFAILNDQDIYIVKEKNETISPCFTNEDDAKNYLNGGVGHPFAVLINNKVTTIDKDLGFLIDFKIIE